MRHAYAVVAYQTAWLKYYYPVEFMAALMTSVIDNPPKVAEYILNCRQMGIPILPPDINKGKVLFPKTKAEKRWQKHLNIISDMACCDQEYRKTGDRCNRAGKRSKRKVSNVLKDFMERLTGKEVNKRTIENFIKAGALDSLCDNEKAADDDLCAG